MANDHVTISIEGGGPYGFRLFGGDGQPLVIAKLRRKSKAWDAGLEEGDVLLSINDLSCCNISHAMAMSIIEGVGSNLKLQVLRKGGVDSDHLRATRSSSRQRSVTPLGSAPGQFRTTPSPAPSSQLQQPVQWSYRAVTEVKHYPTLDNHPQQRSVTSSREFHLQLRKENDSGEEGRGSSPWGDKFRQGFLTGAENLRANELSKSPSQERRFQATPFHPRHFHQDNDSQLPSFSPKPDLQAGKESDVLASTPKVGFNTKTGISPSVSLFSKPPAIWSPPSWQPSSESLPSWQPSSESPRPISTQNATPGEKDAGEDLPPLFHRTSTVTHESPRGSTVTHELHVTEVKRHLVTEGHKPLVWQPSGVTLVNKNPPRSPSSFVELEARGDQSPLGVRPAGAQPFRAEGDAVDEVGERSFDLRPNLNKILTADNVADDSDLAAQEKSKKKVFGDSSFYDDPGHRYPTVDEQIKMARKVALSLTAPVNAAARGHRMFMKRKERSDKWIVEGHDPSARGSDTDQEIYYKPTPWNAEATWKAPSTPGNVSIPTPSPLPTSKLFAPRLIPEDESEERSKVMSAEEFERVRLYSQKTTHNTLSPQICFTLAEDLRQSRGKGGRMFAKRRAKADEWTVEGPTAPDPRLLQKIGGGFVPGRETEAVQSTVTVNGAANGEELFSPPVNRLKEMLELPRPKMTPWDAVAEHGNVELAFEHLDGISFLRPKTDPFANTVASSLQQATQRKTHFSPQRPSPTNPNQGGPLPDLPQHNQWNQTTEPAMNNWSTRTPAMHGAPVFSASAVKVSGGGYRPIHFQTSTEVAGALGGGFCDL